MEVGAAAANLLPRSHSCPQHSYNARTSSYYNARYHDAIQARCHHPATATAFLIPYTSLPHIDHIHIYTYTQIGSCINSRVCPIDLVQSEMEELYKGPTTSVAFLALLVPTSGQPSIPSCSCLSLPLLWLVNACHATSVSCFQMTTA